MIFFSPSFAINQPESQNLARRDALLEIAVRDTWMDLVNVFI